MGQAPSAYLLDLSRLVSRVGRVPTGVDRVERAYLDHLLAMNAEVFGLVRTAFGFVLLDRTGLAALRARVTGDTDWGPSDRLSRLKKGMTEPRRRAEADVRRLCLARCLPARLSRMLTRHMPPNGIYLNVGHSNLTDRVLSAVSQGPKARIAVMIHDTIPVDFPQYQRPEVVARFKPMLRRVRARADWIICNSQQTAGDVRRIMAPQGPLPQIVVVHLGIDMPRPATQWPQPVGFDRNRPWFVTVGTIEPRKNHGFLLDLWTALRKGMVDPMPQLLICGSRGWMNDAVFARLDSDPLMGRDVFELPGLSDAELAAAMTGARGLLFPSHAEGYGLPAIEAASMGVRVICNDLPVYREVLGDIPVYAGVDDLYLWQTTIMADLSGAHTGKQGRKVDVPSWAEHFNTVLSKLV